MSDDERAIRDLVTTWMRATKTGDTETVLNLMADDVVFMVPGAEPFGKREFAAASQWMKDLQIDGMSVVDEIQVFDDWAWMRNKLRVSVTMPNGTRKVRSGFTLTILRKSPDGNWLLARDANLLTLEGEATPRSSP